MSKVIIMDHPLIQHKIIRVFFFHAFYAFRCSNDAHKMYIFAPFIFQHLYRSHRRPPCCQHRVHIQHKIGYIRRKQTGTKDFRQTIGEIAMLICYEATRDLQLSEIQIETPICEATVMALKGKKMAIVPILRAGLSFNICIAATEDPPVASIGSTTKTSRSAQSAGSLQ